MFPNDSMFSHNMPLCVNSIDIILAGPFRLHLNELVYNKGMNYEPRTEAFNSSPSSENHLLYGFHVFAGESF